MCRSVLARSTAVLLASLCFSPPAAAVDTDADACVVLPELHAFPAGTATAETRAVLPVTARPHHAMHGQLVYGERAVYLDHLPVFMGDPRSHPHNFQVILEVAFADAEQRDAYLAERAARPDRLTTAAPPTFDMGALVASPHHRMTLPGTTIFGGHFEQGGQPLFDADLEVVRVVHFRQFVTGGDKLDAPHYLLFGRPDDAYAVRLIDAPPAIHQVLRVAVAEGEAGLPEPIDAMLAAGLTLRLPDRPDDAAHRLRPGESLHCVGAAEAEVALAGDGFDLAPWSLEITVEHEHYCEVGELSALVTTAFNRPEPC
jgi:hypothetical protein